MKSKIYTAITIALCIAAQGVKAQNTFPSSGKVGIGTLSPDASSLLEIRSTSKGFLTPRMTQAQRNAISGPATGLLVYVTDTNPGFYYYSGSGWVNLVSKKGWQVTGNSGLDSASNFIGTTDNVPFSIRTNNVERVHVSSIGNVGIGVTSPAALLHINGGGNVSLTTNGYVLLGKTNNYNLAMDNEQIQARYNGSYSTLYLNNYGGTVYAGNSSNSYVGLEALGSTYGVYGSGSSYGLDGYASSGTGVYGYGTSDGLYGSTSSGSGVYGYADGADNSGGGYGGYFYNSSGKGVEGYDGGTGHGVFGYETGSGEGVDGYAYGSEGFGVEGYSAQSFGVYGSTGNSSSYAGYFSGNVYTSGTYTGSDEKLKQNITDVSSAMDIINQLKPKNYNFRQDGSYAKMNLPQGKHYGLIAQDVEKVLPGLVKDTKFDAARATHAPEKAIDSAHNAKLAKPAVAQAGEEVDFKAVNYTELIPIMIKAMQEQQDVITKLQQQLTALQQTVGVNPAAAVKTIAISSAALLQNTPNPYNSSTTIQYNLPAKFSSAKIIVTDNNGAMLKQINLSGQGKGAVNLDASSMASGNYNYSLFIDGQLIDSKRMILSR